MRIGTSRSIAGIICVALMGCGGGVELEKDGLPGGDLSRRCGGITCNNPPRAVCVDANTLRSYSARGTCRGGKCSYAASESTCANGCDNGACKGDPCAGVVCNTPPAPTCSNTYFLVTYAPAGTCSAGMCSYPSTNTACAYGCQNGACQNGPCDGVVCNSPPPPKCVSASLLQTYSLPGGCNGVGGCSYVASNTVCANGCQNGACVGACSGNGCVSVWTPQASGTDKDLSAVWGSGPDDVYVGGDSIMLHSTGDGYWTSQVVTGKVVGFWGTSSSNIYAVAGTAYVLSNNGKGFWTETPTQNRGGLISVWGSSASDIYVGDNMGDIYHSTDGVHWTLQFTAPLRQHAAYAIYSLWGSSSSDVYAVGWVHDNLYGGEVGLIVHSTGDGNWQMIVPTSGSPTALTSVWGTSASNVYVTGNGQHAAQLWHSTGGQVWNQVAGANGANAIWGTSASDMYVVGTVDGHVLDHYDGTTFTPEGLDAGGSWNGGTPQTTTAIWGSGPADIYVVGTAGTILHGP